MSAIPSLGVRVDALGTEQASAKIRTFGKTVGALPRDFEAASRGANKLRINMSKLSFAGFGASLAITTTITSLSRLEKSALAVERANVALQRGLDLVTRKQAAANRIMQSGERFTGELALAQSELATALQDVIVKEEDVKIKTGEVSDTYINFAASLGSSVLFSVTAFFTAVQGLNLAHIKAKISAIAHAIAMRLVRTTAIQTGPAVQGLSTATVGSTIAMIGATKASFGLAAGLRAVTFAFAPLLIATAAITALYLIYENNVFGVKDGLNGLLGITEEVTETTNAATEAQEGFNDSLAGPSGGLKSIAELLPTKEKLTILTERFAVATGLAAENQATLNTNFQQGADTLEQITGIQSGRPITGVVPGTNIPLTVLSHLPPPIFNPNAIQQIDRLKQVVEFNEMTRNFIEDAVELTKRLGEEEQRTLINAALRMKFKEDELLIAQQILDVVIKNGIAEKKVTQEKKEQASVNLLFDTIAGLGLVGQQAVFGRGPGGVAQRGGASFGGGAGSRFLGFAGGPGSTITVAEQEFRSRVLNPAFGRVEGGQGPGNIIGQATPRFLGNVGSPQFADPGFASGGATGGLTGPGTPVHIAARIKAEKAARFSQTGIANTLIFGGVLSQSQASIAKNFNIAEQVKPIRTARALGLLSNVGDLFENGATLSELMVLSNLMLKELADELQKSADDLGLGDLGEFGPDFTHRFGLPLFKSLQKNRIDDPQEFERVIDLVNAEAERQAFIAQLELNIDRERRFQQHQLLNPGTSSASGGTQLFMDIQPLADALIAILSGQSHKQFISLLGNFKVQ